MNEFKEKYGPWAFVSGASAGLGEEYARQLAARGLNLVLAARREDRLIKLGEELKAAHGIEYRAVAVDLSGDDIVATVGPATDELEIGLLINNAGFTNSGDFLDNPLDKELMLLHVNCRAAMVLAHHYGTKMRERRRGGIVFSASVAGFSGIPYWANYSASKAYDLLLAESLGGELARSNVDVLALCPGVTRTEFADYKGFAGKLMLMDPPDVVSRALHHLGRRRHTVAGFLNFLMTLVMRLFPRKVNSWVAGVVIRDAVKH